MKFILLTQAIIGLVGSFILLEANASYNSLSFGAGAGVAFLNFALLAWVWWKILNKKLIALAVLVIVFKYAIFGLIIYQILMSPGVNALWFSIGLSTLILSIVIYVLTGAPAAKESVNPDLGS